MNKYFNLNLKYLRSRNGIEQLELANMLGLKSASAVSEWEKGIRIPSADILSDLSNIFNVTIDSLMNINLERFNIGIPKPIPLIGEIAAGTPILAEENIDKLKKSLNELIEKKEFNLQDVEIIKASEELDMAITKYNDLINKKL